MATRSKTDKKPRVSMDRVGGDKIQSGNIEESVAAIGAGANVLYNKVERALSQTETLEQAQQFENKRLADALTDYVLRLENQAAQAQTARGEGNPYKALLEFDIQDAALFYGRTIAIRELLTRIQRDQLTVLHAGSGLGKTSLLKAGIMPRLLADGHLPLYVRPHQTPVHKAVKRALLIDLDDAPHLSSISLHDFLRRATNIISGRQLVVIIDQFEELFTVQNEQARNEFIDQLSACLDDDLLPVRWIFAMRDEWFGQLGSFRPHLRNPYANEFLLRPLSRTEAALVITQPAERRQVSYEPALVERLMDDMGRDEIAPPHLQLVCSMLFDSLNGRTEITQAMYEEAGETKGILRGYLYRVLSRDMPPNMREAAHRLLEALVTSEKRRAIRTREDLTTEMSALGYPASMVEQVLNQLTDSRLLRLEEFMLDKVHSIAAYELAHDYLLDEIDITPEAQSRKAAQELIAQKLPYYKREKLLLSPQELSIVLPQRKWLHLSEDAAALLRESEAVATRERRIRRVSIATAILVVIVALSTIAIQQKVAAEKYKTLANTSLSRAIAGQTELAANLGQAIRAYQLAAQAYSTADTFESRSALYTALSLPLPEKIFRVPGTAVDRVYAATFNPGGDRIVTACSDNKARIWDVTSGKLLITLEGHQGEVLFAAYSPDGERIVTASRDGMFGIWDAQTGENIQLITAHKGGALSAVFSPDGSRILTAGQDSTAAIWDANSGEELVRLTGHERLVRFANFSPDGKSVVTASRDNTARVWDALTGKPIRTLEGHKDWVRDASFSPDGTRIVTASADRTARVWDAQTGETLLFLVPHNSQVATANFSPDGKFIVTSSDDSMVRLWDATNGGLIAIFSGHTDGANWAGFSPDGKWIATASNDATVWLRKALQVSGTMSLIGHANSVNSVVFSPDGTRVVTASADTTAQVWDAQTGKPVVKLKGHERGILFATFSPDGTRIATISNGDGTVRVWDAENGSELLQIAVKAYSVNFSPDGRELVTAGDVGQVWDAQTGEEILPAMEGHTDTLTYAAFSPDGTRIVSTATNKDGTVRVWDAKTHKLLKTFQIVTDDEVDSIGFSPDGKRIAVAADPNIAQVWDLERGEKVLDLLGHESDVATINYSPDGRLIVTGSDDHTLRLWDAMTGAQLAVLSGHTDEVNWVTFSHDGKWIFSASSDRTVRTWPVDIGDLYQLVRDELNRLDIK
jgi:WD40 repeat protein